MAGLLWVGGGGWWVEAWPVTSHGSILASVARCPCSQARFLVDGPEMKPAARKHAVSPPVGHSCCLAQVADSALSIPPFAHTQSAPSVTRPHCRQNGRLSPPNGPVILDHPPIRTTTTTITHQRAAAAPGSYRYYYSQPPPPPPPTITTITTQRDTVSSTYSLLPSPPSLRRLHPRRTLGQNRLPKTSPAAAAAAQPSLVHTAAHACASTTTHTPSMLPP